MICLKPVEGASYMMNGKIVKAYRRVQTSRFAVIGTFDFERDFYEDILVLEDIHMDLVKEYVDDDERPRFSQWFYGRTEEQNEDIN
jgi:hypothetical protein